MAFPRVIESRVLNRFAIVVLVPHMRPLNNLALLFLRECKGPVTVQLLAAKEFAILNRCFFMVPTEKKCTH